MPIELIVEDGTGLATANSYVTVAEADLFHSTNLYSTLWPADDEQKKKALITATRLIDQQVIWGGFRKTIGQALQWPRSEVIDPDLQGTVQPYFQDPPFVANDSIPKFLKDAVCLLALNLVVANREVEPDSQGVSSFSLDGVFSVDFDFSTRPGIIPDWLMNTLAKYGQVVAGGSRVVKLTRA